MIFLQLLLIIPTCYSIPSSSTLLNGTECVVAFKTDDGSYNFSLESDSERLLTPERERYDFLIPAAVWFNNSIDQLGWAFQTVKTSPELNDTIQAYWAGFLEVHISKEISLAYFNNTWGGFCDDDISEHCTQLKDALLTNLKNTIRRSLSMGDVDPFWHQMELILWQLRGMLDSWNNVLVTNSRSLTSDYLFQLSEKLSDVYLLQLSGDMSEVTTALGLKEALGKWRHAGREYHMPQPSCSALIKVLPGQEDVYISQVTWQGYSSMLKVAKFYSFSWHLTRDPVAQDVGVLTKSQFSLNPMLWMPTAIAVPPPQQDSPLIPGGDILFSSYPSTIASIDDLYSTSTGLVTLETTNGNHNPDLWSFVRHGLNTSVLEVFRVMIANRLARAGPEWVSHFSRENSGTYNNQWMVFDTKLFERSKPLPPRDLLWVAEQIPGFVQSADVTDVLREKSYWASYNNPYFSFIHNISGFNDYEKTYGDWFNYDLHPRAQIFKRDHMKVDSLAKMYRLMRYNDFTHDPLSRCNCTPPYSAENAISARNDLNDINGTYPFPALAYRLHGATDVKLVNLAMATSTTMIAVSGPTYDDVPPFQWSRLNPPVSKPLMHPDKWIFPPLLIQVKYPANIPVFIVQLVD